MKWTAAQMKPVLCKPGKHRSVKRMLHILWREDRNEWRCECLKCGHEWTEPT